MKRESMEFDVVIVGAGPAGLSAACRLMQQANEAEQELTVCVVEKGSEVGAHILSGAVIESRALDELFPDWKEMGAPLNTPVTEEQIFILKNEEQSIKVPNAFVPKTMHNHGNYIASLGNLCRWLAEQAEQLGVEIFPGFAASEILYDTDGAVKGISTGDMGITQNGTKKAGYMPGIDIHATYTIFAEGCRGNLGKELIEKFNLSKESDPQHYGLGIKEIWDIDPDKHKAGLVIHGTGWPLDKGSTGGSFLYHTNDHQIVVGLIVDLNYSNPHLSPFEEMQRMKHHPIFKQYLEGGTRVSYGARAIAKGGLNSLPKMNFPGGVLIGCDAGTLNFSKLKGTHTAMKSGMIAAETIFSTFKEHNTSPVQQTDLKRFSNEFKSSWVFDELYSSRNFGPAIHKFGTALGAAFNYVDQNIFRGRLPFTIHEKKADHNQLKIAAFCVTIEYPKPDGKISFDKLSSVFISNTNHEENQPCHLKLKDESISLEYHLPYFNEPAQRYCPGGVYEIADGSNGRYLQINAQNCLHCKTCDIKDPSQNITWVTPEGGGGPNYPNM